MRENWRALLSTEADRLRSELPSAPSSDVQATVKHATYLLDQVCSWEEQPRSLREWWNGEGSSRAWLQLREAEAEVVLLWITAVARLHWAPEGNTGKAPTFPSAWLTLLCVIAFGVLGGLISAIPVLARPPTAPDPYGLAVYQGALKLPLGGVFAIIGCLALQSGTLPGVTGVTSLEGLLFWAAAFGASQQAVTRLLDARVGNLLTPPGQATLPHPPRTPVDRSVPSAHSGSSDLPLRADERGHTLDSAQTTAAVSEQATSA